MEVRDPMNLEFGSAIFVDGSQAELIVKQITPDDDLILGVQLDSSDMSSCDLLSKDYSSIIGPTNVYGFADCS